MIREFRIIGIAARLAHGAVHAVDGQKRQRVRADDVAHFLERVGRRQQPAAIRQIEGELGVRIVARSRRFNGFTPEGELVLDRAQRLVRDFDTLRQDLSVLKRALAGRINAYLGRPAVTRVKFIQGKLTMPPPPPPLSQPAKIVNSSDPSNTYQGPDAVKAALQSLARWRTANRPQDG